MFLSIAEKRGAGDATFVLRLAAFGRYKPFRANYLQNIDGSGGPRRGPSIQIGFGLGNRRESSEEWRDAGDFQDVSNAMINTHEGKPAPRFLARDVRPDQSADRRGIKRRHRAEITIWSGGVDPNSCAELPGGLRHGEKLPTALLWRTRGPIQTSDTSRMQVRGSRRQTRHNS